MKSTPGSRQSEWKALGQKQTLRLAHCVSSTVLSSLHILPMKVLLLFSFYICGNRHGKLSNLLLVPWLVRDKARV